MKINAPEKRPGMVAYGYYRFPDDPPGQVRYMFRKKVKGDASSEVRGSGFTGSATATKGGIRND